MLQVRQGRPFVSLEPEPGGGYIIRTAAPLASYSPAGETRVLLAVFPVPERLGALADTVQRAYKQYGELSYLREPLKASFSLTLTLVLLLSLLAACVRRVLLGAAAGASRSRTWSRARARSRKGDFDTRLPLHLARRDGLPRALVQRHDEAPGARARGDASQPAGGRERAREPRGHPGAPVDGRHVARAGLADAHVANQAASRSSATDLEASSARRSPRSPADDNLLSQFIAALQAHLDAGQTEWREQLVLRGDESAGAC